MAKIILVLGAARSGKSSYATELAKRYKKVAFIATCQGLDEEMKERIIRHRKDRPKGWKTFEEPKELTRLLKNTGDAFDCIIIDCLTLLVSNLVLCGHKEKEILNIAGDILAQLNRKKAKAIIVSNEVGLGIVPANKLSRDFRDIAGKVNQIIAKSAESVVFMVAGIPLKVKTGKV